MHTLKTAAQELLSIPAILGMAVVLSAIVVWDFVSTLVQVVVLGRNAVESEDLK